MNLIFRKIIPTANQFTWFLLIIIFFSTPFNANTQTIMDAAALSPSELPSFQQYIASPENIKIEPISAKELDFKIELGQEKITILDARSKAEYTISRLDKAKRMGFSDFKIERVWMIDRNARLVVYSNNEKRALLVAQYMKLMGFRDVHTLANGIIGWKNDGYNVFDSEKVLTDKVHVGHRDNTALLKEGRAIHF